MLKIVTLAVLLVAGFALDTQATESQSSPRATPVAWRGGYRWRSYSYGGANSGYRTGNYGYRGGNYGKTSPLDYPPSSQPTISRMHQWNKYPNQPFYLRGERRSLGILP